MPTKTRARPVKKTPDPGEEAVEFINNLTHTGDFNGEPFQLRPWQEAMVRPLFGKLRADGRRQYTKAFWALPRKQGKTELAAAVVLKLLLGSGKRDQEIYSASGDHAQAAKVYMAASTMVRNDPELDAVCQCYDGYKRIDCKPLNSFYDALSSEAPTKHGLNPSAVVFDELHVLPDRKLFTALTTGFATRREPLTLMITTAGFDRTSLCYEKWKYAEDVLAGRVDDPEFQAIIHAASPEDDWMSEATWRKAMPGLDDFCSLDWIRSEFQDARRLPLNENAFKQLQLNLWTEQAVRWIPVESWTACDGVMDRAALRGRPCYSGLDLGITGDMSAYARVFPDGHGGISILMKFWAPREGKWRDEFRNSDRYQIWAQQGLLTLTPGNTTDHQQIEDDIVKLDEENPVLMLNADRAYATQILTRLFNDRGFNDRVKGITQGPVTMNEATVKFEELVLARKVAHGGDPILAWNVANAVQRRTTTGLVHLDKESATERIDGLAAVLNALAAMCAFPPNDGGDDSPALTWL